MRLLTRVLPILLASALTLAAQNDPNKREWRQLFNGKDLDGWIPKITGFKVGYNHNNTFRVENGVLKASYDKYDAFNNMFGHLFFNERFSHYVIAVEYRFIGEQAKGGPAWAFRNSGIMVHCQAPDTMTEKQDFPISIEVQLLGGKGSGERTTANLCTPGTNVVMNGTLTTTHCINSSSQTYHGDQWVRVEVEVRGGETVKHMIDGKTVLAYEKPQIGGGNVSNHDPAVKQDGTIVTSGYISLQGESHPVEFRKVELLNLVGCMDKKARNYKSYFVQDARGLCQY
jgi:hypothetical protein